MMNIKLVGIAKNDAAYIAEWVFHHLYFGFDEIEVHTFDSDDITNVILQKIINHYPQVTRATSTIFPSSSFQVIPSKKGLCFTHSLTLGMDEFWTPRDFKSPIAEVISQTRSEQTIAPLQVLEEHPFSMLTRCVALDYLPINEHSNSVALQASSNCNILKRNMRSELEYIASLPESFFEPNSHPISYYLGFKRPTSNVLFLEFDKKKHEQYTDAFYSFITRTGIKPLINKARYLIRERAHNTVRKLVLTASQFEASHAAKLRKAFSGISDKNVKLALSPLNRFLCSEEKKAIADLPIRPAGSLACSPYKVG